MRSFAIVVFLVVLACRFLLKALNLRHLNRHGREVPPEFAGVLEPTTLTKIAIYTQDRARLGLIQELAASLVLALFLFAGPLALYDRWLESWVKSPALQGALFFLGITLVGGILSLPFDWYSNFRVEARHGFNRMSAGLWWADFAKSTLLSAGLLFLISFLALTLVQAAPQTWWLWVWLLLSGISILLMYLAPVLIEPLFFKVTPLQVPGLNEQIQALSQRAGAEVRQVLQMDASRRSGHSNAYFTGIGRVKRVVLFDTLLTQMQPPEILGILAHELGHWKLGHILQRLAVTLLGSLALCYLAFIWVGAAWVPSIAGVTTASFAARVFILSSVGSSLAFVLTPLSSYWSRRHEWQADEFAQRLTQRPQDLASALRKLAQENLSNLHPHPLYAAVYYSHPPMAERVRKLLA